MLRRLASNGGVRLLLKGDVSKAHRRVKNRESDWALQACRLDDPDKVYLNKVGTFGIGSAAYWWHRLFAGLARISMHSSQRGAEFWQLVFADDVVWMTQGPCAHLLILMALLILKVYARPLQKQSLRGASKSNGCDTRWM